MLSTFYLQYDRVIESCTFLISSQPEVAKAVTDELGPSGKNILNMHQITRAMSCLAVGDERKSNDNNKPKKKKKKKNKQR